MMARLGDRIEEKKVEKVHLKLVAEIEEDDKLFWFSYDEYFRSTNFKKFDV